METPAQEWEATSVPFTRPSSQASPEVRPSPWLRVITHKSGVRGMLNKQQQIKNGFIYFLPVVIGNLIPIITLPIFSRILSKEDFGALALSQAYAFFITGIANFGLP